MACGDKLGFLLYLKDWWHVDEVITRLAARLARDNLREPVTICVDGGETRMIY
jgi:hypothetical protein